LQGDVFDFMKITMCCPFAQGYGLTESAGSIFLSNPHDDDPCQVGTPFGNVEFKLIDVPELGYSTKDVDEQGRLCPAGELCLRGPGVFKDYFKD